MGLPIRTSNFGIRDEADTTRITLLGKCQGPIKDIARLILLKRHVQLREGAVVSVRPGSANPYIIRNVHRGSTT